MLPLWLIGMAAGAIAHMSAQEKNDTAERLNIEAKDLYDCTKSDFDKVVSETKSSIRKIQSEKSEVLDKSIKLFLSAYDKIKTIHFTEKTGIYELSKFQVIPSDMPHLQEMTNIYDSAITSGMAGAAVGATALAVGSAETLAALGASVTPLAAVAAPVVVFTAISANITADENLSKAKETYAKAEAATEKMKTEITKCTAIRERIDIYSDLLKQLDEKFLYCALLLNDMVENKSQGGKIQLEASNFTQDEIKLIAVTRALAGAVKSVLDTPILGSDGNLTYESKNKSDEIQKAIPIFQKQVSAVENSSIGITEEEFKAKLIEYDRIEKEKREEERRKREKEKAIQEKKAKMYFFIKTVGVLTVLFASLKFTLPFIILCTITFLVIPSRMIPKLCVVEGISVFGALIAYASPLIEYGYSLGDAFWICVIVSGVMYGIIEKCNKENDEYNISDERNARISKKIGILWANIVAFNIGILLYGMIIWLFKSVVVTNVIIGILYAVFILFTWIVINDNTEQG